MPEEIVPRILTYVGVLFMICLGSTFAFFAAAQAARTEYRSLMSALACSMRLFFYSICLLCILVAALSFPVLAPRDPRSELFGWIHIGGSIWIVFPCVWRAFRQKGPRMVACGVLAILLTGGLILLAAAVSPGFATLLRAMPAALSRS